MEKQVLVNESSLVNIADALRVKTGGDTRIEYETTIGHPPLVKISKTKNATSLTEFSGGYGENQSVYDVVTIPGAVSISVKFAYQSEGTSYDYVQVCKGPQANFNSSATKYGGTTRATKILEFTDTDTVTFYFKSDSSNSNYLGYYAEITGFDSEGKAILNTEIEEEIKTPIEVPNVFTPAQMGEVISAMPGMGTLKSVIITGDIDGSAMTATYNLTNYVKEITKPTWLLIARQYSGTQKSDRGNYAMVSPLISSSSRYWGHVETTSAETVSSTFTGLTTGATPLLGNLGRSDIGATFDRESNKVIVNFRSTSYYMSASAVLFYIEAS